MTTCDTNRADSQVRAQLPKRAVNLLWCGSTDNEFGWVVHRLRCQLQLQVNISLFACDIQDSSNYFQCLEQNQVDRIVLALPNRCQYPAQKLQRTAMEFPEIPLALCLGDYWLGWKRTGAGHLQVSHHNSLPWYRWWDGWLPWLLGNVDSMLGPFPSDRLQLLDELAHQFNQPTHDAHGILFCSDSQIAQAWQVSLEDGSERLSIVSSDVQEWSLSQFEQGPRRPDLVIWDDSRLTTCNGQEAAIQRAEIELRCIRKVLPESKFCLCLTTPLWSDWTRLYLAAGDCDLIAKPHLLSFSSAALART